MGFGSGFDRRELARLDRKFKKLPGAMTKAARGSIDKSTLELQQAIIRVAPERSGNLKKAIMRDMAPSPAAAGKVFVNYTRNGPRAPYAHIVEFGSAPHVIQAKAGSKLGFEGRLGFKVMHPGQPPNPFFYGPYRVRARSIKGRVGRATGKVAKEIARGL